MRTWPLALALAAGLHATMGRAGAAESVATAPAAGPSARDPRPACPERAEATAGPLPGGTGPADFGAIPEACGGRDLTLRLRGALLVASSMPDYYGSLVAAATFRVRHPLGPGGWLSVGFDAVTYRYINNGGLASDSGSVGPVTAGYHRSALATERVALALYGRVLLPIDTARQNGLGTGLELGVAGRARLGPRVSLEGGIGGAAPAELVAGQVYARVEPAALAEVHFLVRPWVGLFGGAALRARAGPDPAFLSAAPRLGARVASRRGLYGAVLLEAPVAGRERTDLVAGLHVGYAR